MNGSVKLSRKLLQKWGLYRERCAGPRQCVHVLVDTSKASPGQCHAAHQRPLVATDPDVAQALVGNTPLGQRLFLNHLWKCN